MLSPPGRQRSRIDALAYGCSLVETVEPEEKARVQRGRRRDAAGGQPGRTLLEPVLEFHYKAEVTTPIKPRIPLNLLYSRFHFTWSSRLDRFEVGREEKKFFSLHHEEQALLLETKSISLDSRFIAQTSSGNKNRDVNDTR